MRKLAVVAAVIVASLVVALQLANCDHSTEAPASPTTGPEHRATATAAKPDAPRKPRTPVAMQPPTKSSGTAPSPERTPSPDQAPHGRVVVEVVGPGGATLAGVPVYFLYPTPRNSWRRYARTTTGATGLATALVPKMSREASVRDQLSAYAAIPSRTKIGATIALPQRQPTRLVLPATGSLDLEFIGPDGQTWPWPLEVRCSHGTAHVPGVERGHLRLPYVEVGQRVTLEHKGLQHYGIRKTTIDGPSAAGAVTQAKVRVTCKRPLLFGRLFDPEGRPVTAGHFELQRVIDHEGRPCRGSTRTTPANYSGRLLVPLVQEWSYRKLRILWRSEGRIKAWAELPLRGRYESVMHDIGEIRLSPSVMLAAGVVCEPDAPQLEDGAWVELHPSDQEGDLGSSARIFEDRPIGMCGGLGDRDLLRAGRYHVSVGEHGNFAIRGAPLASPFTLRVKGKPYAASDVKHIMSGTRGLELTVSKWGHVAGWITTSPDVKPEELLVEILGPTVDHKTTAIVYCDGEFSARKIPAGLVRVLVREQGANQPLALVENVRVMSGEATEDPRLDPIDVRGKIRQMSLRVVDPTGRPIPRADVYPQAHALIPGYDLRKTDANGEVSFPVAAAPLRCVVRAAGFRLRCIELSKSATLTIHPGIPVRLYLDFGVPIPAGVTGTVYLGSKDYGWSYARSDRPPAVKKEIKLATPYVDLTVEAPGRHDIRVRIDSGTVADLGSHAITIQDKNERQEFRIRFDPKKVRAELEDE